MAYRVSAMLASFLGVAAGAKWNQVSVSGSAPSARHSAAFAMDSSDRFWIYGGKSGGVDNAEVWRLDTVAQSWTQIFVTGGTPPPRLQTASAMDSNNVMWIFGGGLCCGAHFFYDDLFKLNTVTEVWTEVTSATGSKPSGRRKHSAAIDSSDRMWIFGGSQGNGDFVNALHYLDTVAENWVQVTASGTLPSVRDKHAAVMDSSDRMWVFGGNMVGGAKLGDLHVLDTATETWTQVVAANTPAARDYSAAVRGSTESMWMWAGTTSCCPVSLLSDLHYLGPGGEVWTEITTDTTPPLRWKTHFARDSQNRMWLFGGEDVAEAEVSDLWYLELQGTTTTRSTSSTTKTSTSTTTSSSSTTTSSTNTATSSSSTFTSSTSITTSSSSVTSSSSSSTLSSSSTITSSSSTATLSTSMTTSSSSTSTSGSSTSTASSTATTSSSSSTTRSLSTTPSSSSTATLSTSMTTSSSSTSTSGCSTSTASSTATSSSSSSSTTRSLSTTASSSSTTSSSAVTSSTTSSSATSSSSILSSSITTSSSFSTTTASSRVSSSSSSRITSSSSDVTSSRTSTFSSSTTSRSSTMAVTTAESWDAFVAEVLDINARSLVTQLSSDNVSTAWTPLGRMTAVKLTDQSQENGFAMVRHTIDSSVSTAYIPTETLQNGSYSAVVITTFNGETGKDLMGKGASATSSTGNPLIFSTDAMDVSLFGSDLSVVHVTSAEPIFIKLSITNPEPSLFCAYQLPDGTWSREGVRLATEKELDQFRGVDTSGAWCATSHLSIFAIFVDVLLDCTNINVLSTENLREIIQRPDWWTRLPSLFLWCLIAAFLLLLAAGVLRDVSRSDLWQAKFFLIETPASPQSNCCRRGRTMRCIRSKSQRPSPDLLAAMRELKNALPYSKLQESILCQNTLREASLQHGLHTNLIEEHIWGAEGWVQGSLALQKSAGLKAAALRVKDNLPFAYVKVHASRFRCWFATFVTTHPLFEMHQFDMHITAAKRAKIFMDCILGSLAFVALFFSVDGSAVAARSPEDCPIEQTSFLWLTFVASFSILLNFIPRSLFQCLAFRRFVHVDGPADRYWKLRIHQFKDLRFWTIGACLTALHMLIIIAFLANLDPADEWKWLFSLTLVVVRKVLLVPLLACTISGIVSEIGVSKHPHIITSPPKKFGLIFDDLDQFRGFQAEMQDDADKSSVWKEKVQELAGRGLTLRQLLDFYSDLVFRPQMMPHFDPNLSTTHDVVRHAIIPSSREMREARTFVVQVHRALGLEGGSDFRCALCICGQRDSEPLLKPWKGGSVCSPVAWGETVLLQDVLLEEGIYFAARGLARNKAGGEEEELCSILPSSSFWNGSAEVDIRLGAGALVASIVPRDSLEEVCTILKSNDAKPLKGDPDSMEENAKPNPVPLAISVDHALTEKDAQDESKSMGFAYATSINGGRPRLAQKMVTHSWGNKFCHLISAIFSDALEEETYDMVAQLLMSKDFEGVSARLQQNKKLDVPYWVCAFSVNQHAGICARVPPRDSTGREITACSCSTAKHFEGDLSEMNKFDDMMAFLKQHHRQKSQVHLEQVVAMEIDFGLLTRVWCVAELVEADKLHLHQAVKVHSASSRENCVDHLLHLDVREAQASFPADKDLVLSKIEDVHAFNHNLRGLMLQRLGTFLAMNQVTVTAATVLDDVLGAVLSMLMG
ncbi:unnamed protein product [Effrenium voratum]|uniref:Uncharacterized protein n=1 Tax=Effrenium voratum TaxID=2562239 RepID=A0AA36MZ50_9DINO|nr:unnamed protein product [Effrenium voratum]CAJ1425381.1 unnamed protein product [Effrenium voratum]